MGPLPYRGAGRTIFWQSVRRDATSPSSWEPWSQMAARLLPGLALFGSTATYMWLVALRLANRATWRRTRPVRCQSNWKVSTWYWKAQRAGSPTSRHWSRWPKSTVQVGGQQGYTATHSQPRTALRAQARRPGISTVSRFTRPLGSPLPSRMALPAGDSSADRHEGNVARSHSNSRPCLITRCTCVRSLPLYWFRTPDFCTTCEVEEVEVGKPFSETFASFYGG